MTNELISFQENEAKGHNILEFKIIILIFNFKN